VANTLVTPVGRINNTSATPLALGTAYDTKYATYLKLFSGEMFKAYESSTIAKGTVQSRTLKNGKAMQFIFTGRMTAAYHEPGTPILGSGDPPVAEKTIVCDDLLISNAFVYDLDETLAHYSCVARSLRRLVTLLLKPMIRRSSVRSLRLLVKHTRSLLLLVLSPAVASSNWV
jgi:hypothetical protein